MVNKLVYIYIYAQRERFKTGGQSVNKDQLDKLLTGVIASQHPLGTITDDDHDHFLEEDSSYFRTKVSLKLNLPLCCTLMLCFKEEDKEVLK